MDLKEMEDFLLKVTKHYYRGTEEKPIKEELAEIKKIFLQENKPSSVVRIPVAKLIYLTIIGFPVDFGLQEIITLLNSSRLSNVRIGYMAASLILSQNTPSFSSIIQIVKQHLKIPGNDLWQSTALSFVSTVFDSQCIKEIINLVADIAICQSASEHTRKKAILYLAYVLRGDSYNSIINLITPPLETYLITRSNLRLASSTLVLSIMIMHPGTFSQFFSFALKELFNMFVDGSDVSDIMYYGTPAPWYSKQLLRMLKLKLSWSEEEKTYLEKISLAIFSRTGETLKIREAYSYLMVLNELMALIAMVPLTNSTMERCAKTIARHLNTNRVNILSFAIETLLRIIKTNHQLASTIQDSLEHIFNAMRSPDNGVSKLAVFLLEQMINEKNYKDIINEIMSYIPAAPLDIRKALCSSVPKVLALECVEPKFFVKTNISLLKIAGNYAEEITWQSTASKFKEIDDQQEYIHEIIDFIKTTPDPPVLLMKLAVYVIGEYTNSEPLPLLNLFVGRFGFQNSLVQSMIVTMITKLTTRFPEILLDSSLKFLSKQLSNANPEVSQRANECMMTLQCTPLSYQIFQSIPKDFNENMLNEMLESIRESVPSNFEVEQNENIENDDSQLIEKFLLTNEGVIYTDNFIAVYAKLKYGNGNNCNVAWLLITISNVSVFPLQNINFETVSSPEFSVERTQFSGLEIDKGGSIDVKIAIKANNIPLSGFPVVILSGDLGGNFIKFQFRLPIFPRYDDDIPEEEENYHEEEM